MTLRCICGMSWQKKVLNPSGSQYANENNNYGGTGQLTRVTPDHDDENGFTVNEFTVEELSSERRLSRPDIFSRRLHQHPRSGEKNALHRLSSRQKGASGISLRSVQEEKFKAAPEQETLCKNANCSPGHVSQRHTEGKARGDVSAARLKGILTGSGRTSLLKNGARKGPHRHHQGADVPVQQDGGKTVFSLNLDSWVTGKSFILGPLCRTGRRDHPEEFQSSQQRS